jgi:hypothetical protein
MHSRSHLQPATSCSCRLHKLCCFLGDPSGLRLSSQGLQTSWKSGTAYLTCVSESRLQARWLSVRDVQPRDRCISPERQVTGSGRAWTLRPLHPHQGFLVCILCLHFEEMPPSSFSQPHEPPLTLDRFLQPPRQWIHKLVPSSADCGLPAQPDCPSLTVPTSLAQQYHPSLIHSHVLHKHGAAAESSCVRWLPVISSIEVP